MSARVGAVVLAAGGSTRFGKPKALALFRGQTFVERAAVAAASAGCAPVIVIAGSQAIEISSGEVVVNHEWRAGLSSSIRVALQHLLSTDHDLDAILFLACDQPLVSPQDLQALLERWRTTGKSVVASAYADTWGIPALFARVHFPDLLALEGDRGAKDLILAHRDQVAAVDVPAAAIDIDTAADYERLRAGDVE